MPWIEQVMDISFEYIQRMFNERSETEHRPCRGLDLTLFRVFLDPSRP
jgi:hypothetical protein